ncbi:MAG: hypothetical protein F6K61_17780 [Sphaerospermopsis sp. SIO1G1]|nr:hypothetical protein [Sphaerospermopsis sp. SIO1G1]
MMSRKLPHSCQTITILRSLFQFLLSGRFCNDQMKLLWDGYIIRQNAPY